MFFESPMDIIYNRAMSLFSGQLTPKSNHYGATDTACGLWRTTLLFICGAGAALLLSGCASIPQYTEAKTLFTKKIDVTLISNQENTRFRIRHPGATQFEEVGTGKFVTTTLSLSEPIELTAKAPGYQELALTVTSPNRQIQFFFLKEHRLLTVQSDQPNTQFRIRKTGDARWQEIKDKGESIECSVPHEGSFEIEARPPGYFPKIMPVLDPTGKLVFSDFTAGREMELTSNQDYTKFKMRNVGQGESNWEDLGVSRSLRVKMPASGGVEISAEPLYYREKRQVLNEFQDQLPFTFTDEDKISPPKPEIGGGAVPTRGSLPPRPPQLAGKLSGADLAGITGQESWRCMLIGIADYRRAGASHPDLGTPTNDVLNLKALLEQQYGFESSTVLLNGQATMQGIRKGFWELHKACQPNDNVLIFYAGHGTLAPNGAGQWVCADGTELSNAEIKDVIQRLPARRVLLISDSCFSGEFVKRELRIAYGPEAEIQAVTHEISQKIVQNKALGRQVITSGQLAPVNDRGQGFCQDHSPFTCQLLIALRDAAQPGAVIGTTDLHTFISDALSRQGLSEGQMPQRGVLDGDGGGEYYFVRRK